MLAGTHVGLAARIAAALGEVGMGESHADDALGASDQLQIALIPHVRRRQIVIRTQLGALIQTDNDEICTQFSAAITHSKCCGADISGMQLSTFAQLQKVSSAVPVIANVQIPIAIGRICLTGPTNQGQNICQAVDIAQGLSYHYKLFNSRNGCVVHER